MLNRLKKAMRGGDEKPIPRKTTEVRLEPAGSAADAVERAHTHEPALVLLEGDLPGQVFRLRDGRQTIGRRPECDIRVRERAVSGIHAEVIRSSDSVTINDLASTNGTLVNGMRIRQPVPLAQGNLLKVGNCIFRYVDSLLEVEFTEALHAKGITDSLTGAYNKSYLVARLGFLLDTASESRPVSVITFDFDQFKQVNDEFGHAAGDYILRVTSELVRATYVRETDVYARMGGEEFVIALVDTPLEAAVEIAQKIRAMFEKQTFDFEGATIRLTSSFGVAAAMSALERPEVLLARADDLLYESKRKGRNRVSS